MDKFVETYLNIIAEGMKYGGKWNRFNPFEKREKTIRRVWEDLQEDYNLEQDENLGPNVITKCLREIQGKTDLNEPVKYNLFLKLKFDSDNPEESVIFVSVTSIKTGKIMDGIKNKVLHIGDGKPTAKGIVKQINKILLAVDAVLDTAETGPAKMQTESDADSNNSADALLDKAKVKISECGIKQRGLKQKLWRAFQVYSQKLTPEAKEKLMGKIK
jgi:hypothetical protein